MKQEGVSIEVATLGLIFGFALGLCSVTLTTFLPDLLGF